MPAGMGVSTTADAVGDMFDPIPIGRHKEGDEKLIEDDEFFQGLEESGLFVPFESSQETHPVCDQPASSSPSVQVPREQPLPSEPPVQPCAQQSGKSAANCGVAVANAGDSAPDVALPGQPRPIRR